ncbi:class I SAM-dependent methyltransferase [Actinoplanes siamensis]|uniref:Methyltransferase domain-containing protein n=1 Tax=Actinoplanes siamensis TaxID=1223317 RepID=A0A919TP32_9ACTN|nr:class I SAM-dependent methyltransferase [Actinoplanes siamensis]GIF09352.1 hypothetical protein Asi03nite_68900 [Actinoplanes siamensis]
MTVDLNLSSDARYCADTFNGAVAAAALSAAWEIGLLDELDESGLVDLSQFAERRGVHLPTLHSIVLALTGRRIATLDAERRIARPGMGFAEAFRTRGFFYWLTQGCGELFTDLPRLSSEKVRAEHGLQRDSAAISRACRSIARNFFDPPLAELLAGIEFTSLADLGCGSGDRVISIVDGHPGSRGIGIDIAQGALEVAAEAVADAGLEDRITLLRDDVLNLTPNEKFAEVDLLTSFLMGHDFWPLENCRRTLRQLREAFPNAKGLLLGDTCRSTDVAEGEYPLFTLGFELVHSTMGQFLPTLQEWETALDGSGWRCHERRLIDLPAFSFIYHLVPA